MYRGAWGRYTVLTALRYWRAGLTSSKQDCRRNSRGPAELEADPAAPTRSRAAAAPYGRRPSSIQKGRRVRWSPSSSTPLHWIPDGVVALVLLILGGLVALAMHKVLLRVLERLAERRGLFFRALVKRTVGLGRLALVIVGVSTAAAAAAQCRPGCGSCCSRRC